VILIAPKSRAGRFHAVRAESRQLRSHPALSGWLYTPRTTRGKLGAPSNAAGTTSARRKPCTTTPKTSPRRRLGPAAPVIDEAMLELKEHDRTAVLLRFFENRTYAEIGTQLSLSENTARMRVDRALDTLRVALAAAASSRPPRPSGGVVEPRDSRDSRRLAAIVGSGALAASAAGANAISYEHVLLQNRRVTAVILTERPAFSPAREMRNCAPKHRLHGAHRGGRPERRPDRTRCRGSLGRHARGRGRTIACPGGRIEEQPGEFMEERVGLLHEVLEKLLKGHPGIATGHRRRLAGCSQGKIETTTTTRALGKLRNLAIAGLPTWPASAQQYLKAHDGQFPADLSQLQSYVDSRSTTHLATLLRSAADTGQQREMGGKLIVTQRAWWIRLRFGVCDWPDGFGTTTYGVSEMIAMEKAWAAANPATPKRPHATPTYATTPRQKAALARA